VALAEGIVDQFQAEGLPIFGPTQAAARIESSKAFAKAFMQRHDIPTAAFATFSDYDAAYRYLRHHPEPVVIKASGLAGGKGVILPDSPEAAITTLQEVMIDKAFGQAGDEIVIEPRLSGPEVSVLAFSDGRIVRPMPPAQDHKRVFDNDQGANTGGMGAYAPAPICPPALLEAVTATILQPTIDGLRAEGTPFVGCLYAGLMLTEAGPQVIEFNCRFGDPEAQVILPLLESDLVEIIERCLDQSLADVELRWKNEAAATVVLAAGGYPGPYETGRPITGLAQAAALEGVTVFHAGTKLVEGQVLTAGGRVLNVTGTGPSLIAALKRAYAGVAQLKFEGRHYRKDIGARAVT
jgi:phosphoribosylamine--glycine ligase